MWQVPVLSLTAQAFLFTITLDSQATRGAQILAAVLALVASLTSIQLMAKHRHHEVSDAKWLESFEKSRTEGGFQVIHAKRKKPVRRGPWRFFVRQSSYVVWLFTLWIFALGACAVLLFPSWFAC